MSAPKTIYIDQDRISENCTHVDHGIDASGRFLIPGFFDSHVHPSTIVDLETLTSYGVTTSLQMTCKDYTMCNAVRGQEGLSDFYTAGVPAQGPDGAHAASAARQGRPLQPWQLVYPDSDPVALIDWAFGNGSDCTYLVKIIKDHCSSFFCSYLDADEPPISDYKIVVESGGPSQDMQNRLVEAAHALGKQTMSHASDLESYIQAIESRSDGIQHTPDDGNLSLISIDDIKRNGQWVTPTISVFAEMLSKPEVSMLLRGTSSRGNSSMSNVYANVRAMHRAGVPILAGTDAVGYIPTINVTYPFGISLHQELQNLVEAGMTPVEALNAATRVPALFHRLNDRGFIAPGMRADLILLNSNPLVNVSNSLDIERVWAGGRQYANVTKLSTV